MDFYLWAAVAVTLIMTGVVVAAVTAVIIAVVVG